MKSYFTVFRQCEKTVAGYVLATSCVISTPLLMIAFLLSLPCPGRAAFKHAFVVLSTDEAQVSHNCCALHIDPLQHRLQQMQEKEENLTEDRTPKPLNPEPIPGSHSHFETSRAIVRMSSRQPAHSVLP